MERTYSDIAGLTYADLDNALRHLGYVRYEEPEQIIYKHPTRDKARLIYPVLPLTREVRGIDLVATRAIVDGFGVADGKDFDLLLIRLTGNAVLTLTR